MIGKKFKVVKFTSPAWQREFADRVLEVCEGYTDHHHQVPAMTAAGRTWFNRDTIEWLD